MYISLASVNPSSTESAIKCLIAMYKTREFAYETSFLRKLTLWGDESREFAERFKMLKVFNQAIRLVVSGRDVAKHDDVRTAITSIFEKIKEQKTIIDRETDVTRAQLGMINDLRLAYNGSEAAENRLMRNVSSLRDADLNEMFLHTEEAGEDMQGTYAKLATLVKKYGKINGYEMPVEILKEWQAHNKAKGTKLKQHEEYLELRKQVNAFFKKQLANLIRSSGEPYLPVAQVKKALGATLNPIPETFVGMIDDLGGYYTVAGKKLLQTPAGVVQMNPAYDAKLDNAYVCTFKAAFSADFTRVYTEDYRKNARGKKFDVVAEAMPNLANLTKKWLPDLPKAPDTKDGVCALLSELIYQTSGRIGSTKAATDGKTTHGISTLLLKHVNINDQRIIMNYLGKSGGKQRHIVKFNTQRGQLLHTALVKAMAGKKPADHLITFKGKTLPGSAVNIYLKSLGFPTGFTIHKLRTAKGSELAMKLLEKPPFKKGEAKDVDVNKWVESQLMKVGEELGHLSGDKVTANTAIANYIDPAILAALYTSLGARPNAKIQKAIDSVNAGD